MKLGRLEIIMHKRKPPAYFNGKRHQHELTFDEIEVFSELTNGEKYCYKEWLPGAVGEADRPCVLLVGHEGDHEY